jgi:hypothetical protein
MDVYKIAVKVFARGGEIPSDQVIALFQRWIRDQSVPGHRLIDVADYAHVVAGPGTVLVASEANFHIDHGQGRLGILYFRKSPIEGSFRDRLHYCVGEALKAAAKFQGEAEIKGKIEFEGGEILIRLNDRLLAPVNEGTVGKVKGDLEALGAKLYGAGKFGITPKIGADAPVEFNVKASQATAVETALKKLHE